MVCETSKKFSMACRVLFNTLDSRAQPYTYTILNLSPLLWLFSSSIYPRPSPRTALLLASSLPDAPAFLPDCLLACPACQVPPYLIYCLLTCVPACFVLRLRGGVLADSRFLTSLVVLRFPLCCGFPSPIHLDLLYELLGSPSLVLYLECE